MSWFANRSVDLNTNSFLWDAVEHFTPGRVYAQGNMEVCELLVLEDLVGLESVSLL